MNDSDVRNGDDFFLSVATNDVASPYYIRIDDDRSKRVDRSSAAKTKDKSEVREVLIAGRLRVALSCLRLNWHRLRIVSRRNIISGDVVSTGEVLDRHGLLIRVNRIVIDIGDFLRCRRSLRVR